MRHRLLSVLAALSMALAVAGCGGEQSTGQKGYISGEGVITRLPQAERKAPGSLSGTTLDGGSWDLADHRGSVVVVNVWASWCPPCRAEAPSLVKAAQELQGDQVEFVGIDVRDGEDAGRAFEDRYDVPYPSLDDPAGRSLLAFRGTLPPNAIPSTIIIDATGKVAALILGRVPSTRTLSALVDDVRGS